MPALQGRTRRRRRLGERIAGLNADPDALTQEQQDKIGLWSEYPWKFLTGTDVRSTATPDFPYGRPLYWTKDERDKKRPVKPFPAKGYLREYIEHVHTPRLGPERFSLHEAEVHAAVKSRQMILTTATLGYLIQQCAFLAGRLCLISKVTEDESKVLIEDKVRFPFSRMPDWLRGYIGMSDKPSDVVRYRSGSRMVGVAMTVAKREARGSTASDILVDEAVLQDLPDLLASAKPMATRIFIISTPDVGPPGSGADEFRQHVELTVEDTLAAMEGADNV